MNLEIIPTGINDANDFVNNFHRHNKLTRGGKGDCHQSANAIRLSGRRRGLDIGEKIK